MLIEFQKYINFSIAHKKIRYLYVCVNIEINHPHNEKYLIFVFDTQ